MLWDTVNNSSLLLLCTLFMIIDLYHILPLSSPFFKQKSQSLFSLCSYESPIPWSSLLLFSLLFLVFRKFLFWVGVTTVVAQCIQAVGTLGIYTVVVLWHFLLSFPFIWFQPFHSPLDCYCILSWWFQRTIHNGTKMSFLNSKLITVIPANSQYVICPLKSHIKFFSTISHLPMWLQILFLLSILSSCQEQTLDFLVCKSIEAPLEPFLKRLMFWWLQS